MSIKLYNDDCIERMEKISNKSIDMILTDLPYGVTACKWDSIIPLEPMWEQLKRITKFSGAIVMTASQPFTTILISSNMKMFKYCWVWYKNMTSGFALAKKQPLRNHEEIIVFYIKQPTYNPIKELRDMTENSLKRMEYAFTTLKGINVVQNGLKKVKYIPEDKKMRYPTTVKKFKCVPTSKGRLHPTQKPVALMEYLIKTYTNKNETVLDFAMGSGTTGIACKNLNRSFIGIELDKKYFKIAEKRISKG